MFTLGKRERKDDRGRAVIFDPAKAVLSLPDHAPSPEAVLISEQTVLAPFVRRFEQLLRDHKRKLRKPKSKRQVTSTRRKQ